MSAQPVLEQHYISEAEYIESEITSEVKREYYDGEVFAMAGASASHNRIVMGLSGSLQRQLTGTPCEPFGSDQRVKIEATGLRTYPDVTAACNPIFEDERQLDLLNPIVIFEVLSFGSTAKYDRGEKFRHYRQIASLLEYILVEQERPHIEHFIRQENGGWLMLEYDGLEARFKLASVEAELSAAEIYERVEFSSESPSLREQTTEEEM